MTNILFEEVSALPEELQFQKIVLNPRAEKKGKCCRIEMESDEEGGRGRNTAGEGRGNGKVASRGGREGGDGGGETEGDRVSGGVASVSHPLSPACAALYLLEIFLF